MLLIFLKETYRRVIKVSISKLVDILICITNIYNFLGTKIMVKLFQIKILPTMILLTMERSIKCRILLTIERSMKCRIFLENHWLISKKLISIIDIYPRKGNLNQLKYRNKCLKIKNVNKNFKLKD